MPADEICMPCGCPYPKLGDHRPCEHGYPGDDSPEPVTFGELLLAAPLDSDRPVMLRIRGEVFPCTGASLSFEDGRYVLMLDGESRG